MLPSAYVIDLERVPTVNGNLLTSVEVTSTSPLTIQYVISPRAVWSDGVPVTADDFIYAWQSQRGDGVDIDGHRIRWRPRLGYRDVASITSSHSGKTATVVFSTPYTDWRLMFDDMVPAHIARRGGMERGIRPIQSRRRYFGRTDDRPVGFGRGDGRFGPEPEVVGNPPSLNRITVNDAPDQAAWMGALSQGQLSGGRSGRLRPAVAGRGVLPAEYPKLGRDRHSTCCNSISTSLLR